MVYSRPIKDQGARYFKNVSSYHFELVNHLMANLVTIAAPSGIPRKTATLIATVEYEIEIAEVEPLMTRMKNTASGA